MEGHRLQPLRGQHRGLFLNGVSVMQSHNSCLPLPLPLHKHTFPFSGSDSIRVVEVCKLNWRGSTSFEAVSEPCLDVSEPPLDHMQWGHSNGGWDQNDGGPAYGKAPVTMSHPVPGVMPNPVLPRLQFPGANKFTTSGLTTVSDSAEGCQVGMGGECLGVSRCSLLRSSASFVVINLPAPPFSCVSRGVRSAVCLPLYCLSLPACAPLPLGVPQVECVLRCSAAMPWPMQGTVEAIMAQEGRAKVVMGRTSWGRGCTGVSVRHRALLGPSRPCGDEAKVYGRATWINIVH